MQLYHIIKKKLFNAILGYYLLLVLIWKIFWKVLASLSRLYFHRVPCAAPYRLRSSLCDLVLEKKSGRLLFQVWMDEWMVPVLTCNAMQIFDSNKIGTDMMLPIRGLRQQQV